MPWTFQEQSRTIEGILVPLPGVSWLSSLYCQQQLAWSSALALGCLILVLRARGPVKPVLLFTAFVPSSPGNCSIYTFWWPLLVKQREWWKYSGCLHSSSMKFPYNLVFPNKSKLEGGRGLRHLCIWSAWFPSFFLFFFFLIYLFLAVLVFVAARGLSLVAASGGCPLLRCAGFSLWWLLVAEHGLYACGLSSCGSRALERGLSNCGARA